MKYVRKQAQLLQKSKAKCDGECVDDILGSQLFFYWTAPRYYYPILSRISIRFHRRERERECPGVPPPLTKSPVLWERF